MADKTVEQRCYEALKARGVTFAAAESCTGGLIAKRITDVPGASGVFMGGVVSYTNIVKHRVLGVPADMLEEYGAVSAPVARAMAEGARKVTTADCAVSVTGVAGPDRDERGNAVGTVFIGFSSPEETIAERFDFGAASRAEIREEAADEAFKLLEEKLKEVMTSERGNFRFMEPMKRHTTFRIGGPAAVFISPGSEEELREVLNLLKEENIPWTILGNGSNLLVSDEGFKGAVISMSEGWAYSGVLREDEKAGKTLIRAGAGELLSRTARLAMECSLTGMEFASGIPGTIGGALVMNAGAYGGEMKDVLKEVTVMTAAGEILVLPAEKLEMGYRTSLVKTKGYLVLSAVIVLEQGNQEAIKARMKELTEQRVSKQPLEFPSAGSTFKRPEGYFAGKLIMDAGLRGYQTGGAQVSEKHCGFVINKDNATAADVCRLLRDVQDKVKEQFGVTLEPEVKFLGKF